MRARKSVHPLLLEPVYWRNRLAELRDGPSGVIWTPRPDLSGSGQEVTEFRVRAHDGERLWGLFARPTWQAEPWPATVRSVGPAVRPATCARTCQTGTAEFIFQEPAGRRLSDRVMDVMQICRLALGTKGIEEVEVQHAHASSTPMDPGSHMDPGAAPTASCADELLIVEQLLSRRIASVEAAPPEDPPADQ